MSVPLDRLYNFLHDVCNRDDIIIYRFYPHGSKKIRDCSPLLEPNPDKVEEISGKRMVCHDQEPLHLDYYRYNPIKVMHRLVQKKVFLYDKVLLLHSEKRSAELEYFENDDAIGVYWWSHAVIARDWFRYAELDPVLSKPINPKFDFLVYNRAWTGSREYRLRFSEMVVDSNLSAVCYMNFNVADGEHDYRQHQFSNPALKIKRHNIEQYFRPNEATACYSADYNAADYQQCAIEIVLETLFDDPRWHLTEKVLRPIACGKPFILAATAGSLEYLKGYGFKTFSPWIDESYDAIGDPVQRLQAIIASMQKFSSQSTDQKNQALAEMQKICDYNKHRFFSANFMQEIVGEFLTNFQQGLQILEKNKGKYFKSMLRSYGSVENISIILSRQQLVRLWSKLNNGQDAKEINTPSQSGSGGVSL